MKLSRLYRPQDRRFWLMIVLNLLSTVLAWIARRFDLAPVAALMVAAFAIGNALLGVYLMWLLMRDDPARPARDS